MEAGEGLSLEQIRAFLEASDGVGFQGRNRAEVYSWVNETFARASLSGVAQNRARIGATLSGKDDGIEPGADYASNRRVEERGRGKAQTVSAASLSERYTREDVALLAAVDTVHETLSGPATQKLLQRAYHEFAEANYERLAGISVAQLYRLRGSARYRQRRIVYRTRVPLR